VCPSAFLFEAEMASSDDELALMLTQLAAKLQERKAGVEGQPQKQPPDEEGHSQRRSQPPMELWLNDGTDDLLEDRDENVHMELRREIRRASDAGLLGGAAALAAAAAKAHEEAQAAKSSRGSSRGTSQRGEPPTFRPNRGGTAQRESPAGARARVSPRAGSADNINAHPSKPSPVVTSARRGRPVDYSQLVNAETFTPKLPPGVLDPEGQLRTSWDMVRPPAAQRSAAAPCCAREPSCGLVLCHQVMLVLLLYIVVFVPIAICFEYELHPAFIAVDLLVRSMLVGELVGELGATTTHPPHTHPPLAHTHRWTRSSCSISASTSAPATTTRRGCS
jgi:hypothetical protein